jgi:hypothetical protein
MVRGMDAKSVDLCFAGVVELPFPCLHARLSPMWLVGEKTGHLGILMSATRPKSISGTFPVSSTVVCWYSGYSG